ncbi:MAG TPA: AMP-binding protein [Ilumatobacter sp.]|nr:AMP-binding protein [Ilumatobacter sp.]
MTRATIAEVEQMVAGTTIPTRFVELLDAHPDAVMLRAKSPAGDVAGGWDEFTVADVAEQAGRVAAGLRAEGVQVGERVLLMMRNRPDFHWLDLAAQLVRATPVSIYNSSSPEEIAFLAADAGARVAIVENAVFLDRLLQARTELPELTRIFVIEPPEGPLPDGVAPVAELHQHGTADIRSLAADTDPADLATLIYTSGTTGPPKGVMISQRNASYTLEIIRLALERTPEQMLGWKVISYLPMAHIAERTVSHYNALVFAPQVTTCPDMAELSAYLGEVRPQLFVGVPRVWEKIYAGVNAVLANDPDKAAQFNDGVAAATQLNRLELERPLTDDERATREFLDAVAFSMVRGLVGLDEVEIAVTTAAPIPAPMLEWFTAIGVPISEVYGMSESSGPIAWSPYRNKPGYVGQAYPGMEVAIADDGEVICRGGNVFEGYLNLPDKTAETVIDGWLHSGDIGELDDEGYLRIVDRKKELIITSGGKNISPANLEAALKMIPVIGQAAVIGDARKFISALLVLDPEAAPVWAAQHGKAGASLAELAGDADLRAEIQRGVDAVNEQFAQVEQIKKFVVLGEEWLPDSDVLTPTMKLKRRGIHQRYAAQIEAFYTD